jgi:hypothetical protein
MGHLELPQPFEWYVSFDELPTDEGHFVLLRLRFRIEDSDERRELTWPFIMDNTHRSGTEACAERVRRHRQLEMDTFRQHVEYELGAHGARAYGADESDILVWAKAKSARGDISRR